MYTIHASLFLNELNFDLILQTLERTLSWQMCFWRSAAFKISQDSDIYHAVTYVAIKKFMLRKRKKRNTIKAEEDSKWCYSKNTQILL